MFGIDFSEILVIFAVALVVLGPQRLPKLAATIGRWLGRARAMARQFREQLEQEASRIQDSVDLNAPPGAAGRPYPGHSAAQPPGAQPASPVSPDHSGGPAAAPTQSPAEPAEQHADGAPQPASSTPERTYTLADAGMPEPADQTTVAPSPQPGSEVHAGVAGATPFAIATTPAHEAAAGASTTAQAPSHASVTASGYGAQPIPKQAVPQQPVAVEADERGG
jgi:sec-independent protein translocase protein TatB